MDVPYQHQREKKEVRWLQTK